jgi:hypothetical protein
MEVVIEAVIAGVTVAVIVAAALLGDERRCLERLRRADAVSQANAVKPEEAGISGFSLERALQRLIKRGKIKKTEDSRIFLPCKDEKVC